VSIDPQRGQRERVGNENIPGSSGFFLDFIQNLSLKLGWGNNNPSLSHQW